MKEKSTLKDVANNYLTHTKNIKGITLIALVVTIIVLLILASVAISLTIGNNGIITRAMQAKEITEMATLQEEANFVKVDLEIGSKALNADLTQGILLNAINIKMEGSVLQGNKVITSNEKYAVVVQNDSDLTINVIRYREGILAEGELGLDLEYDKDSMQVYIYPKVGGLQSYADYAKEELAKLDDQGKIDIVVKGICKQSGITEEEFYKGLQEQGKTVEEIINYAIQQMGLKDIDELIIVMRFIEGYEEKENILLDITYNNGTVEKISYPEQEYLTEAVSSNSTYNYKVNYGIQQVSKSIDVTVKEKVDQTQIFEYDAKTGYITGIKEEYLSETPPEQSKKNKDGKSTFGMVKHLYLTYGYPYLTIPEEIDGTTIIGIDEEAFKWIQNITVVEIPNTIKEIKDQAFWTCNNLEIVNLPSSITKIGQGTFMYTSIKKVYIPNSVETIGNSAFDVNKNITIDCEVESKPAGWDNKWYGDPKYTNAIINWGVKK